MANLSISRPGTRINWIDRSGQTFETPEEVLVRPLFLQPITSDRGPEDMRVVHGQDFYKLYGFDLSYKRHGQPLIQAANIIDNGGELLVKRVVAEDATLANLVILAKVKSETVQKTNANGELLYIDSVTGEETIDNNGGSNKAANISVAKIKYDAVAVEGAKTINDVITYASRLTKDNLDESDTTAYDNITKVGDALTDENPVGELSDGEDDSDYYIYPLCVITDNGRGVSTKRVQIVADFAVSKGAGFQFYKLVNIGEYKEEEEYIRFSVDPDVVYLNTSMSLSMSSRTLTQIKAAEIEDAVYSFIDRVSSITGVDADELKSIDILFGNDRKGNSLSYIQVDENGFTLDSNLGMMLQCGTNGAFGDAPFANQEAYTTEMVKVFDENYNENIFNVDKYYIDVCMDANYPIAVKEKIVALANFREDFFFFRDIGLGHNTYNSCILAASELTESKFAGTYIQSWGVIDKFTKKQIEVTATYSMASKMVSHLLNRRHYPSSGELNNFSFQEVIEGSVSFEPKITPSFDQKTDLDELSLNYASQINGIYTMETSYTSQYERTQLSWSGNILAVTDLIHKIRKYCPKHRYSFITASDLNKFKDDVNTVIKENSSAFASCTFEYTQDEVMAANKVFEASIYVSFMNFEQAEVFNIYTID